MLDHGDRHSLRFGTLQSVPNLSSHAAKVMRSACSHPRVLVQRGALHIRQVQSCSFEMILDSARGANHDINTLAQGVFLGAILGAAIEAQRLQTACRSNIFKIGMHLYAC